MLNFNFSNWTAKMSPNTNPETGIRYGVLAFDSIDREWMSGELWYQSGTNISEEEAYEEARASLHAEWQSVYEEAQIAANETDPNMSEKEREAFIERFMSESWVGDDEDDYVGHNLERMEIQIDEPTITGTYDGVDYMINWLGGAPLLWILKSPHRAFCVSLCSPCVPNAGDLDGGFEYADDGDTYAPPWDWLSKEAAEEIKANAAEHHL